MSTDREISWTSDSANAEIRAAWQSVYDALCHRASGAQYAQIRALLVDEIFAVLADTGLLLEPGGESETQHAVRWPSGWIQRFADRASAEAAVKERHDWAAGDSRVEDGVVVARTVVRWREDRRTSALYHGPWRPADTPGEPA